MQAASCQRTAARPQHRTAQHSTAHQLKMLTKHNAHRYILFEPWDYQRFLASSAGPSAVERRQKQECLTEIRRRRECRFGQDRSAFSRMAEREPPPRDWSRPISPRLDRLVALPCRPTARAGQVKLCGRNCPQHPDNPHAPGHGARVALEGRTNELRLSLALASAQRAMDERLSLARFVGSLCLHHTACLLPRHPLGRLQLPLAQNAVRCCSLVAFRSASAARWSSSGSTRRIVIAMRRPRTGGTACLNSSAAAPSSRSTERTGMSTETSASRNTSSARAARRVRSVEPEPAVTCGSIRTSCAAATPCLSSQLISRPNSTFRQQPDSVHARMRAHPSHACASACAVVLNRSLGLPIGAVVAPPLPRGARASRTAEQSVCCQYGVGSTVQAHSCTVEFSANGMAARRNQDSHAYCARIGPAIGLENARANKSFNEVFEKRWDGLHLPKLK